MVDVNCVATKKICDLKNCSKDITLESSGSFFIDSRKYTFCWDCCNHLKQFIKNNLQGGEPIEQDMLRKLRGRHTVANVLDDMLSLSDFAERELEGAGESIEEAVRNLNEDMNRPDFGFFIPSIQRKRSGEGNEN